MKSGIRIVSLIGIASIGHSFAASSIQLEVGEMRDSSNAVVIVGTWVVMLNAANDGMLPGGIAVGAAGDALGQGDVAAAATAFTGVTLALNEIINGDRIVGIGAVGSFDLGDGYLAQNVDFATGQEGLAYGIYWFPGLEFDVVRELAEVPDGSFEVGGVFDADIGPSAPRGMFSPPAPVSLEGAVFDVSNFKAISIPEPATFTLAVFGLGALLRRRRD